MQRSGVRWAIRVIAPWCLGFGLVVSIAADAGQYATVAGSFASLTERATGEPSALVPDIEPTSPFGLDSDRPLVLASIETGTPSDYVRDEEIEPRRDVKRNAGLFPSIDRTHKGDPLVGLRPTFDSHLRGRHGLDRLRESQMIGPHDDEMPAAGFSLQDKGEPLDGATVFAPWAEGEDPQEARDEETRVATAAIAMRPAALKERLLQGATPRVSRAEALSSTTPTAPDGMPIEATFTPQNLRSPEASVVPRSDGHPNYAALLTGEHGARERKCLAEAVYFEARSEPEEGQAAVAQVVLNRATSGLYPASICGVVYQNRTHYKACQFSFACEGKSLRVTEPDAWATARRIADDVLGGKTYVSDVGGATHYHAKYVRPGWARRLVKMDVIGHHIFYKLRPGQS